MSSQQIKENKLPNSSVGFPIQLHTSAGVGDVGVQQSSINTNNGNTNKVPVHLSSGGTINVPIQQLPQTATTYHLPPHLSANQHPPIIQFHVGGTNNSGRFLQQVGPNNEKKIETVRIANPGNEKNLILNQDKVTNSSIQMKLHSSFPSVQLQNTSFTTTTQIKTTNAISSLNLPTCNSLPLHSQTLNSSVPSNLQTSMSGSSINLQNSNNVMGSLHVQMPTANNTFQIGSSGTSNVQSVTSLSTNPPIQLQNSTSSNSNMGSNVRPMPPMVYIQTSTGLKPVSGPDVTSAPGNSTQIIVRRPTVSTGIQLLSSMNSKPSVVKNVSCNKPVISASTCTPSIVIQKPKTSQQNLVPVTAGKHTFATYLSAIKKPPTTPKTQESQSVLSTNFTPTTTNQKLIITPMNVPKIQNTKFIFPSNIASKGPVINFQIANGQLQNDPQGNITVLQDAPHSKISSEIPPLQLITKNATLPSNTVTPSNIILETKGPDKSFPTSIPGSRAELIGEQEYALSIPETNSLNDDMLVSISDENVIENIPDSSYTITIPDKGTSLLDNNLLGSIPQIVEHNVPSILRRSNSDSGESKNVLSEQRRISLSNDDKNSNDIENKIEKAKIKLFNKNYSILNKPILDKSEDNRVPSLYCEEKLEQDLDTKPIIDNEESMKVGQNGQQTNNPRLQVNKDRRKSRISRDVNIHNEIEKIVIEKESNQQMNSIKNLFKSDSLTEEDSLGLQWQNDIALLKGSSLQFRTNEFGLIDVIDISDISMTTPKYQNCTKLRLVGGIQDKKATSPEDLYCCDGCGCHGMAAEFITPHFCSHTCQRNYGKYNISKEKLAIDLKKKRKPRKSLIVKSKSKDEDELLNFNKINTKELTKDIPLLESLSSDISVKITTSEKSNVSNESKPVSKPLKWKHENGFNWSIYLDYCRAIAAPEKFFKTPVHTNKHGFKVGMKLEAIDPVHPAIFAVVTITEIQGFRMKLHFDGFHEDYDFWVNEDSCDIFPPGWCEKNGSVLRPPMGFTQTTFSWSLYVKQTKAVTPSHLFPHIKSSYLTPNGFRIGMKLEAEDRKNSLTCVATVADIMNNRILIHFDSWDDIYDYWVDPASPYIHPVGWCDENGYSLTPPNTFKDPENFTWEQYLKESNAVPVPPRAFKPRPPHRFKTGMKLEAVDKRVPFLVRVATITDTRFHQIRISFDGWPDELSYWVEDDSPDIFPVGCCFKTGHPLEPPLTPEDLSIPGECGTFGCQGLGNNLGAKVKTHNVGTECPYRLPTRSPVLRDRLAELLPPPLHTEPRPKEPRKLNIQGKTQKLDGVKGNKGELIDRTPVRGRPHKQRKLEDEGKIDMPSDEDSNSNFPKKRKRASSPMCQEKVERSVFEPGYLPNPSWNAPPTWSNHCIPLDDVLQRQALRADPRNWSQTDVQEFVEKIAKSREISWRFCKQRIDGESFLMLAQEDLVTILGMRLGPAIKVYNSIIQLRKKIVA